MTSKTMTQRVLAVALVMSACSEPDATPALGPNFDKGGEGRPVVLVNPHSQGNGTATTIQEGIDMVAAGGRVMVKPGTYNEKVTIDKGVTLEGIDLDEGPVVIERIFARVPTPGFPVATAESSVVRVNTSDPVEIRNIGLHHVWVRGLIALNAPQLTLDNLSLLGEWDSLNVVSNNGITVVSRAAEHGGARAHLALRNSRIDTDGVGIQLGGDVDALIEHNVFGGAVGDRNSKGTRIGCLRMSPKGQVTTVSGAGMQLNVDIVNNDLIDCGVNNAIAIAVNSDTGTSGTTATGKVNIVGNRFVYSTPQTKSPCNSTAIQYSYYTGRIEHNSFIGSVQSCANPTSPAAAIRIGNAPAVPTVAGAAVAVRFNDVQGNLFGGLRVRSNQTTSLDARCNYWGGSAPSIATGVATGAAGGGQDVLVEAGAAAPLVMPYAADPVAQGSETCGVMFSLWSAPVNLGATINTAASEQNPNLSPDELSLYFVSDRVGGGGGLDIWVSRRVSVTAPWGSPVNLGPVINSTGAESAPSLSADGHLLFFFSDYSGLPGAQGGQDLYVSHRTDPTDDLAWEPPVNLGSDVNTAADEAGSSYVPASANGITTLYFNRRPIAVPAAPYDLYSVPITEDGLPSQPAAPIAELNTPAGEFGPEVSSSGREVVFGTGRPGGVGGNDLWVAIRGSIHDAWSTPENLGTPINTTLNDRHPSLSNGDRTMYYASTRTGTLGSDDLWMATRTVIP